MPDDINNYLDFIKEQEGYLPTAKWDNKQYSVGYGTRTDDPDEISGAKQVSEEEAYKRLSERTAQDREYIVEAGKREGLEWEPNEVDALTSFTYNLGRGNLDKLISGRDKATILDKMGLYTIAAGEQSEGLVKRRAAEAELFKGSEVTSPLAIEDGVVPKAENVVTPTEEIQDSSVADRSYLDYSEMNIPMSVLRSTPAQNGNEPTTGEIWEAAKYRHWILNAATRSGEAIQGFDENYRVDTEALVKYNEAGYSDIELGFLAESVSESNFGYRVERIKQDREMRAVIERGGLEGTGLEMLAGIADPALLPTLFLGGTAAAAGKWNSAKAIGLSFLSGSSQNVAAEYILKMGDTQRTDEDLLIAASMGGLFSGAITTAGIGLRNVRTRTAQANQIEAAHKDSVRDTMEGVVYNKADKALSIENTSAVNRKRVLTEKGILAKLQKETGSRTDSLSSKKIKAAKQEFRDYRKGQVKKIEAVKASLIRPSAKNKQIAQLQKSIDVREQKLNQVIADNNDKLSINSNLDALQQGKVPDSLQSRYNELKKESGEMTPEPQKNLGEGLPARPSKPVDENGAELPPESTVGAMQTRRQFSDIQTHDSLLPETEIDEIYNAVNEAAALGFKTPRVSRMASRAKGFRSLSTTIDNAPDDATRGIGIQVFKNGTRTIEGHQSAEELAETLFHRNTPDYLVHESAFDEYAKAKGLKWYNNNDKYRQEFDKEVVLLQATHTIQSNKHVVGDDPVLQAAKARSRIYERSLQNNKDYGVIGFERIDHSHSYHSVVYSADNILGVNAHSDNIVDVVAKAYETGGIKLSRVNAVRLANTQLERTFAYNNGGNGTFKKAMSEEEFKLLDKELTGKGVDATTIAELKSSMFNKEDLATMSPRAMFSLKPNLSATSGDVRMVDLIDTSMNRVMKYASDSGANAGLARQGYKSRNQLLRAMEEARSQAINDIRIDANSSNPKIADAAKRALADLEEGKTQKLIEDGVKLMYREPLTSGFDAVEDLSKILRKQTSITRLRSTGLMSLPENAIAMARNGAMNTLRNLPQSRYFNLTKRSIEGDKFMNDFARTFSATGHQEFLFGAKFYKNSDFDDATKGRVANAINKFQGKAMTATMTMNAFRSIQHGGEEMVARSIVSNLKELAVKGQMTKNSRSSLVKVGGLSEAQVDEMIEHFNASPDVDIFDSVRQMPPELYNSVAVAARNTIGSSFMRMGIGESVPYANREMGKVMTTLLNFSIGSWEKMVVRGFKSDGTALMASMFAGQAALAMLSQYAYVYSRAQTMDDNKRAKYIEKNLNDEGLFWGIMNRVGFLAAPAIPLQILASTKQILPDAISASPTKAGISEAGVPSVSMGADLFKAAGSSVALIADKFNDEYMSNADRERNWKNIRRVTPWIDSFGYNVATGIFD